MAGKKIPANSKKQNNTFNVDEEIVIGINKKVDKHPNNKKRKKTKAEIEREKKKKKKIKIFLSILSLIIIFVTIILFLTLSPIFNIEQVNITGNEKISTTQIMSLSQIILNENTFKYKLSQIEDNIKENAYIESVKVSRTLTGDFNIEVKERTPSFMIEIGRGLCLLKFTRLYTRNFRGKPCTTYFRRI